MPAASCGCTVLQTVAVSSDEDIDLGALFQEERAVEASSAVCALFLVALDPCFACFAVFDACACAVHWLRSATARGIDCNIVRTCAHMLFLL